MKHLSSLGPRRIGCSALVLSGVAMLTLAVPVEAASTLSNGDVALIQACEHPSVPGAPTLTSRAHFELAQFNIGKYPPSYAATGDLGLFSQGATILDCFAGITHISARGTSGAILHTTTRLATATSVSGLGGIVKGGFTPHLGDRTVTVWVSGVRGTDVSAVTLSAWFALTCPHKVACPGALIARSTPAVFHGRYFLASMVIAYASTDHPNFNVQLERQSTKGPLNATTEVGRFTAPNDYRVRGGAF